ncbi:hypothetical protein AAXE64_27365 [Priestia megaterium]|uniref:hypothetical protein n=1 Tax=Priestia megaterium TaxID=1404 RepID=UPI003D077AC1
MVNELQLRQIPFCFVPDEFREDFIELIFVAYNDEAGFLNELYYREMRHNQVIPCMNEFYENYADLDDLTKRIISAELYDDEFEYLSLESEYEDTGLMTADMDEFNGCFRDGFDLFMRDMFNTFMFYNVCVFDSSPLSHIHNMPICEVW